MSNADLPPCPVCGKTLKVDPSKGNFRNDFRVFCPDRYCPYQNSIAIHRRLCAAWELLVKIAEINLSEGVSEYDYICVIETAKKIVGEDG